MTDRDAFLRAIADAPDDDAPRLVFADWLDEQGEPERAEFVRIQCAAEAWPERHPEQNGLEARAKELLLEQRHEWEADLPADAQDPVYRRGFLESIFLQDPSPSVFSVLARWLPPVSINLQFDSEASVAALAAEPALAEARRLLLFFGEIDTPPVLTALLQSPYLTGLTELDLSSYETTRSPVGELLANWPGLRNLQTFAFADQFGAEGLTTLLKSLTGSALCSLHIAGTPEDNQLSTLLPAWPGLAQLRRLHLEHVDPRVLASMSRVSAPRIETLRITCRAPDREEVTPDAVLALLSADLPRLRDLDVWGWGYSRRQTPPVLPAPSPSGDPLVRLSLNSIQLGSERVRWLMEHPRLEGVQVLDVVSVKLDDACVETLARSPNLSELRSLNLVSNPITPVGFRALAESPYLRQLAVLNLSSTSLDAVRLRAMTDAPWLRTLTELHVHGNIWTDADGRALAALPFERLRRLGLSGGRGHITFPTRVAEAGWFGGLEVIQIAIDDASGAAWEAVVGSLGPGLRRLDARGDGLTLAGLRTLLARPLPNLKRLTLGSSGLPGVCVRELADWPGLVNLVELEFRGCELQTDDVWALAKSPFVSRRLTVDFSTHQVDESARTALQERVRFR